MYFDLSVFISSERIMMSSEAVRCNMNIRININITPVFPALCPLCPLNQQIV